MESAPLSRSGLSVSRISLGCGNFGGIGSAPEFFGAGESREEAFALMDAAWELWITFFDTADAYGGGSSERWVGEWLRSRGADVRERIVLCTKVFHSVEGDPGDGGLAPARIRRQVEGSLARLGVERIDLYLAHEPDPETPLEETLGAFEELAQAGPYGALATERTLAGVDALARAAAERGVDAAGLSLAWLLADERVTSIVVGPRPPAHLDAVRRALELPLTPAERDELAALF